MTAWKSKEVIGDCEHVLPTLETADAVVIDPPYPYAGFDGKSEWNTI